MIQMNKVNDNFFHQKKRINNLVLPLDPAENSLVRFAGMLHIKLPCLIGMIAADKIRKSILSPKHQQNHPTDLS
jgi:hypothetical protein